MEKDQGVMRIEYEKGYQDIVHMLISNGYEVTVSYLKSVNTITIKYAKKL